LISLQTIQPIDCQHMFACMDGLGICFPQLCKEMLCMNHHWDHKKHSVNQN
jgi:hypothetical protein